VLLGLLQGPAELLPVSSSGHLALLSRLLGRRQAEPPPALRKAFDVALHAGSAPALVLAARAGRGGGARLLALTLAPPALAGLALERVIERRLGGVRCVAGAQVLAGAVLLAADARPPVRDAAGAGDHLAVGLAQAAALVPGVSRSGAALSAARLRGLSQPAAVALSLRAGLPVTVAAAALKGARLLAEPPPRELRGSMAAGAAAALASGLAALPLVRLLERPAALRALAGYRIALGAVVLAGAGFLAPSSDRA
jgi:undecaprenyl-diphosphatase